MLDIAVQWNLKGTTLGGWYAIVRNGTLHGLIIWAISLVLGKFSRWLYVPMFCWMIFILMIEWFIRINFNMALKGDIMLFLAGTSRDEVRGFITQFLTVGTIGLFILSMGVLVGGEWFLFKARYGKIGFIKVLLGCLVVGGVMHNVGLEPWAVSSYFRFFDGLICKAIVTDSIVRGAEWRNLAEVCHGSLNSTNFFSKVVPGKEPLGVIVIGESATRNHMHLYGYPRETTPWADSMTSELIVFSNLLGSASHTQLALKDFLTDAEVVGDGRISYTLPQVVQKFGYASGLVSAQGSWGCGHCDSYAATIFNNLDQKIYLDNVTNIWPKYDSLLFPYAFKMIDAFPKKKPAILFLHLLGSHYDFKYRYPSEKAKWMGRNKIDQYDNSIAYTDLILSNIVSKIKDQKRVSFVLYLSDHGESPSSAAHRDQSDLDVWELPLFMWFSPEYKDVYPDTIRRVKACTGKPLQLDQLMVGILEIMQIAVVDDQKSFLSENFKFRSPRFIKRGDVVYKD